jgi:hemerythrin superfamily protein
MLATISNARARVGYQVPARTLTNRRNIVRPVKFTGGEVGADVAIKQDHDAIKSLYKQFKNSKDQEQKQQYAWQLLRDLTLHSLAEEEVVYPEINSKISTETRDRMLHEHTDLKKVATKLDGMKLGDEGYEAHFDQLYELLKDHIQKEENEDLPKLAAKYNADELKDLGARFEKAKEHLPTRPHVLPPNKPSTGNVIANAGTAPIDALRDQARFGEQPPSGVKKE